MLENLYLPKALIGSEWLLFRLSGWIGKIKSLEKAIDPMNHLGVSQALTQKVINHVKRKLTSVRDDKVPDQCGQPFDQPDAGIRLFDHEIPGTRSGRRSPVPCLQSVALKAHRHSLAQTVALIAGREFLQYSVVMMVAMTLPTTQRQP